MHKNSEIHTGNKHVEKFLKKISNVDVINVNRTFKAVEDLGIEHHLKTQDIKKIRGIKEDIYEIKVSARIEYRFLGYINKNIFTILHVFIKKTQKDIKKEIDLAIKRFKDLI